MQHGPQPYRGNQPRSTRDLVAWLARGAAATARDAEIPIVDAHHHLFGAPTDPLFYELGDLERDLSSGHRIIGTVYVEAYDSGWRTSGPEAMRPVGEIEKIIGLTGAPLSLPTGPCQVAAGIVGHADLSLGDAVEAVLDAEAEAGQGRFCGIRHRTATVEGAVGRVGKGHPRAHLLVDPVFQRGVACLGARGLTFDAWAYHTQLSELIALADAVPQTTIIVDHVAGPIGVEEFAANRAEILRRWEIDLRALAARPNIRMKIGGMGMALYGFGFEQRETPPTDVELAAGWTPLIETCIGIFGTQRCMFESNFPVDKQSGSYCNLWNAFKIAVQGCSRAEKADLFYRTACDVYGLPGLRQAGDAAW